MDGKHLSVLFNSKHAWAIPVMWDPLDSYKRQPFEIETSMIFNRMEIKMTVYHLLSEGLLPVS